MRGKQTMTQETRLGLLVMLAELNKDKVKNKSLMNRLWSLLGY